MSKILKLKPGVYWFFGYDNDKIKPKDKILFSNFLNSLPIKDVYFDFRTGDTVLNARGLFYFKVDPRYSRSELHWVNKDKGTDFTSIIDNPTHVRLYPLHPKGLPDSLQSANVSFEPGKTRCNETCTFYWFCDRERNSEFNPTIAMGLPCEKFKHNKKTYKFLKNGKTE